MTRVEKELEAARDELSSLREAATGLDILQQQLQVEERSRQAIEAERDEQRQAIGRLENQLSEARESEHRLERKVEDLADQLLEAREALSVAEDRLAAARPGWKSWRASLPRRRVSRCPRFSAASSTRPGNTRLA